ncbi:MAG: GumC family protein [Endozoicomonas sp.]
MQSQDYLREFATIFFIRKRVIFGTTLAALLLGLMILLFVPSTYQAKGSVMIKGGNIRQAQDSLDKVIGEVDPFRENDIFSEMQILQSPDVVASATEKLIKDGHFPEASASPEDRLQLTKQIVDNLKPELIPKTSVIRVALSWNDPDQARLILATVFEMYLIHRKKVFNPDTTVGFFKHQLDAFRSGLTELEHQSMSLSGGNSAPELRDKIKRNDLLFGKLSEELNIHERKLIEKRNYVDYLKKSLKEKNYNFFTSMESLELSDFAQQVQQLLIDLEDQKRLFADKSTEVRTIQRQLDSLYELFYDEVVRNVEKEQSELISIQEQISLLRAELNRITSDNRLLNDSMTEVSRLDREREVMEESYKTFATRYREAKIRSQTASNHQFNVSILEQPALPRAAVFPIATSILPTSLIIGLILGLTLGFLLEFFDRRIKRPEDIIVNTGSPYLFSIPRYM